MKKMLLTTKGEFVHGVFIPSKIKVPKEAVNEAGEPVKNGWGKLTQQFNPPTCNGVPKPAPKEGELGDWFCVDDQWTWFPG